MTSSKDATFEVDLEMMRCVTDSTFQMKIGRQAILDSQLDTHEPMVRVCDRRGVLGTAEVVAAASSQVR